MNTKVLIQTLIQVPDLELLRELQLNLNKNNTLVIPDIRKLFTMLISLFLSKDKKIVIETFIFGSKVYKTLLITEVQICWKSIGNTLITLLGEQNEQIRKKSRLMIMQFFELSNNSLMILEKLYYDGLQHESALVSSQSMKIIFKIIEQHHTILAKKTSINIIKLIIEKIIRMTSSNNMHLSKNAHIFLDRLFYLKISCMDEVMERMDSYYLNSLEKIWDRHKENLLYKQEKQSQGEIKYQQLPLINEKFFGIYQPFVMKNLFNPETKAAHKYAVNEFKTLFLVHEERLKKFVNIICKIIQKVLPSKQIQMAQILHHILAIPGIGNITNLTVLHSQLLTFIGQENTLFRKQMRECLKKLSLIQNPISLYKKNLQLTEPCLHQDWISVFELLNLVEYWSQHTEPANCYPPVLNFVVCFCVRQLKCHIPKIKQKCAQLLEDILEKYPSYRQTLEEVMSFEEIGLMEDEMQRKRNSILHHLDQKKQAKETFQLQYEQERKRYLKEANRK